MGLHCQLLELFRHANAEAMGSNSLLSLPSCLFFRLICIWLDCCYNDSDNICKLNPLTKHTCRCGERAWWNRREPQANLEGNHDNPVSGSLQAPSHWDWLQWRNAHILTKKTSKGKGRLGAKTELHVKLLHAKATWAKWLTSGKVL